MRNFKDDSEIWRVVLREIIFNTLYGLARGQTAFSGIKQTKVFKEKDVFFFEVAVLEIANHVSLLFDRETAELVSQVILAVINPVEDLTFGILSLWQDSFPINP